MVLCAWTAFMLAGSSFAKLSENFGQAVPARMQSLAIPANPLKAGWSGRR